MFEFWHNNLTVRNFNFTVSNIITFILRGINIAQASCELSGPLTLAKTEVAANSGVE